MEEVAEEVNNYGEIRFIEGLTVLLQSFGGETIAFFFSGSYPIIFNHFDRINFSRCGNLQEKYWQKLAVIIP